MSANLKYFLFGLMLALGVASTSGRNSTLGASAEYPHRAPAATNECTHLFDSFSQSHEEAQKSGSISDHVSMKGRKPGSPLEEVLKSDLGAWRSLPDSSPIRVLHEKLVEALSQESLPRSWITLRATDRGDYEFKLSVRVVRQGETDILEFRVDRFEIGSWTKTDHDLQRDQGAQGTGVFPWLTQRLMSALDRPFKWWIGPNSGRPTTAIESDLIHSFSAVMDATIEASRKNPSITQVRISAKSLVRPSIQRLLREYEFRRQFKTSEFVKTALKYAVSIIGYETAFPVGHVPPLVYGLWVTFQTLKRLPSMKTWSLTLDLKPQERPPTQRELEEIAEREMRAVGAEELPPLSDPNAKPAGGVDTITEPAPADADIQLLHAKCCAGFQTQGMDTQFQAI